MREVEDSGIDVEEESIVKSTIEGGPLTVRIKLPKAHRTYTERKQALKSNLKKELRKTEKFFQIVSLPEKKDVFSPLSFFSRSSDPVLPQNKVEKHTNDFDKLNATVPLTLSKNFNIINKKHRKVTLNADEIQKLEKYGKKLNKFLAKKGLRKLSKPEKKRKKYLESVSKVKRVKRNSVNYRELYSSLFSKRSLENNPKLFSKRLESMIDLRYDFNYEKRPYYKARNIVNERIKMLKYPPIKIRITLPSPEKTADNVDPAKIPRTVASSWSPTIEASTNRKSTSATIVKELPQTCSLPRIPRKQKVDDPLKKDQDNLQSSNSTPSRSSPSNDSSHLVKSTSTEINIDLISKEEDARKKREREDAEERRRRQDYERHMIEQRNLEIEKQRRIYENTRRIREAAEKKRVDKELMEQALKKQEEEARELRKAEEMSQMRIAIERKKADADEREKTLEKLKLFKEQSIGDYEQIQKEHMANKVPSGEPPMKMIKIVRTPQPDNASRDVLVEKDGTSISVFKPADNSISPTFAKATIDKEFHFDRQKPPRVRRYFPTKAEKEKWFERFYSFENCNFITVRNEVEEYRSDRQKKKKDELEFDENGPPKSLSIQTLQHSAMKMVNGLLGVDDDYHTRESKMLFDGDEWDYMQISCTSLQKQYEWPFEKTKGVYWPIVLDPKKTKDNDRDEHIRRLLKNHSYSSQNLTSFFLTDDPSVQKARDGFLEAYISSGTDELDVHEWARYNSKGGRFSDRKPFKTISTDQTREDGVKKHYDEHGREVEHENRYLEARNGGIDDNNARLELISHYVQASRIDVYSLRDKTHRNIASREKLVYPQWTDDGYNFQTRTRDRYLGIELEKLTDYYDSFLRDVKNEQFNKWCSTPMLVSLHYQMKPCSEIFMSKEELAELKARRVRYNEMCGSRYPIQTKLSLVKHMCKLTDVEKRFWTILYDNLICNFKDLPTLSQLMDRPEFADSLNKAYRDVTKMRENE